MYLNKQKKWMVYDVKIDGISLVTNYRSTFATEIRNDGMDKLIENLSTRNQKVKL
jgi:phospholipid transport system substrate-binding protein